MPAKGKVSYRIIPGIQPFPPPKALPCFSKRYCVMLVTVNNQPLVFTAGQPTLSHLLLQLQLGDKKGIAVAIQDQIVPKSTWPTYALQENDKVTIIHATQGG
jgi:sulfur carrier protein